MKEIAGLTPYATGARSTVRAPVHHSSPAPNNVNAAPTNTAGPLSIPAPLTLTVRRPDSPDGEAGIPGTPAADLETNSG
ncbi:hypothetical protein ACWDZ4_05055 [Streptomyces sp. NPDC003016]